MERPDLASLASPPAGGLSFASGPPEGCAFAWLWEAGGSSREGRKPKALGPEGRWFLSVKQELPPHRMSGSASNLGVVFRARPQVFNRFTLQ